MKGLWKNKKYQQKKNMTENKKVSKSLSNEGIIRGKSADSSKEISKKLTEKKPTNSEQEFEQILQELESPDYVGEGFWSLPENATALERSKYDICQKILTYQKKHKLTDKEIAKRINLTTGEAEDILFCRIDYFTLDRLITYANELFEPLEMKITKAQERNIPQLINDRKKEQRKNLNLSL